MTVTFSMSGSSFPSKRPTDLTARFTKMAIDTIAMAITINEDAMTTMIQNIGSCGLIWNAGKEFIGSLPIADCQFA
jgi:hypothetical protein